MKISSAAWLLCLFLLLQNLAFAQSKSDDSDRDLLEDQQELTNDFELENYKAPKFLRVIIGDIKEFSFRLGHHNDGDMFGINHMTELGESDDRGRTGSLILNYKLEGTVGSLEVDFKAWLFSRLVDEENDIQDILEENNLTIKARLFKDKLNNFYLILGTQATYQTDSGVTMGAAQDLIHEWTGSTDYTNTERGVSEFWMNAIVGVGRNTNLVDNKYFKVDFLGEITLNPSTRFKEESHVQLNTRLGVGIGRYKKTENPIAQLNFLFDNAFYFDDGRHEFRAGVELAFPIRLTKSGWYLTPTLSHHYYSTNEDEAFNGEGEYVSAIYLTITKRGPLKKKKYVFKEYE